MVKFPKVGLFPGLKSPATSSILVLAFVPWASDALPRETYAANRLQANKIPSQAEAAERQTCCRSQETPAEDLSAKEKSCSSGIRKLRGTALAQFLAPVLRLECLAPKPKERCVPRAVEMWAIPRCLASGGSSLRQPES